MQIRAKVQICVFALVLVGIAYPAWSLTSLTEHNYPNSCQHCHGFSGAGNGPASKLLPMKTPNWTINKPEFLKSAENATAKLKAIRNEKLKKKPKFHHFTSKLSKNNLYALALYIKRHKGVDSDKHPQMYSKVYDAACSYCHGFYGNGIGIIKGFTKTPKNFRATLVQKMDKDGLYKLLVKSQLKVIRLKTDIPHFPGNISADDLEKIAKYIHKNIN